MREYEELLNEHQELQRRLVDQPDTLEIEHIQKLMEEIRDSGAGIRNAERRDRLRAMLKYWGVYIYEKRNKDLFPAIQLLPYEASHVPQRAAIAARVAESPIGYLVVAAVAGTLVTLVILAVLRVPPRISIESPLMDGEVSCVPQAACPLAVRGSSTRGVLQRRDSPDICVLVLVHPQDSLLWYPWKAGRPDQEGIWQATVHLGSAENPPRPDQGFAVAAALLNCAWFSRDDLLQPVEDISYYSPSARSKPVDVTTLVVSPARLVPQLDKLGAEYEAFSDSENLDQVMTISWLTDVRTSEPFLHTSFTSSAGVFGGWFVRLPLGTTFNAQRYSAVCLDVKGKHGGEDFDLKLGDTSGIETFAQIADYTTLTNEWQNVCIPLSSFEHKDLDLVQLRTLAFGFRKELGDVSIHLRKVVFQ